MIKYYNGEFEPIAHIFRDAVHEIAIKHYSQDQVNAWCPKEINYEWWKWRCELKRPFLYVDNDLVVGFIELDDNGHIDCHYVRPDYNRKGVGGVLLKHVINIADKLNKELLYVEASHIAKGLYLKNGFTEIRSNEVIRRGVKIENWILERKRAPQPDVPEPPDDL